MTRKAQSLDGLHRNKLADVRKGNRFYVHPHDVHFIDGFNVRDYDAEDVQEHIDALAEAYKAGRYVPPIIVKVIDSVIYVLEGHCRTLAMRKAITEGADLGQIEVEQFTGSEEEADALVLTSNQNLTLKPLERAQKFAQMVNRGRSEAEIAEMIGRSTQHVKDHLAMHRLPDDLKALINENAVSASQALASFNEHGTEATAILRRAQEATGKKRVTQKHVEKVSGRGTRGRVGKKTVTAMAGYVRTLSERLEAADRSEDGSATLVLTADEISAIAEMRQSLPDEPKSDDHSGA